MSRNVKNMAHSVHARLKNEARATERPFNELLQYYAMERFLYRLGQSPHTDQFVLKGALLLRARGDALATRPTRDIDLLRHGHSTTEHLADVMRSCCTVEVEDDGMRFDPDTVASSEIRPEAVYEGSRIKFEGYLGSARVHLQVDVGTGDAVVPGPVWIDYPGLLDFHVPRLRAYTLESAVAEKYQAMVDLGLLNSRMKDYFDVWWLAEQRDFGGLPLAKALRATFARRDTSLPAGPPDGLTDAFADEATRNQWNTFLKRARLEDTAPSLPQVIAAIRTFLMPPTKALQEEGAFESHWPAGGPWS
jgi:hypothetical protein